MTSPEENILRGNALLSLGIEKEFPQCSVAAAAANEAAANLIAASERCGDVNIVGLNGTAEVKAAIVPMPDAITIELPGKNPGRLILLQRMTEVAALTDTVASKRRSLGSLVKKEVQLQPAAAARPTRYKLDSDSDPVLVIMLEDNIALPLATFARRHDGTCDYVQIGSEMRDDNLYVTTSDDATSRLAIAEAFRDILVKQAWHVPDGKEIHAESKKIIGQLAEAEMELLHEQLASAYERYLVERCFDRAHGAKPERMVTIDADGSSREQTLRVSEIMSAGALSDGRQASLVLAAEGTEAEVPGRLTLAAVTRGKPRGHTGYAGPRNRQHSIRATNPRYRNRTGRPRRARAAPVSAPPARPAGS